MPVTQLLAASGIDPDQLRDAAQNPDFLRYVLDFMCEDDRRIVEFAAGQSIRVMNLDSKATLTAVVDPSGAALVN